MKINFELINLELEDEDIRLIYSIELSDLYLSLHPSQ